MDATDYNGFHLFRLWSVGESDTNQRKNRTYEKILQKIEHIKMNTVRKKWNGSIIMKIQRKSMSLKKISHINRWQFRNAGGALTKIQIDLSSIKRSRKAFRANWLRWRGSQRNTEGIAAGKLELSSNAGGLEQQRLPQGVNRGLRGSVWQAILYGWEPKKKNVHNDKESGRDGRHGKLIQASNYKLFPQK